MKRLMFLTVLILSVGSTPIFSAASDSTYGGESINKQEVGSVIREATLFSDQARVVREITLDIPTGKSEITITDVPEGLINESVTAEIPQGTAVMVSAVSVKHTYMDVTDDAKTQAAKLAFEKVSHELTQLNLRLGTLESAIQEMTKVRPTVPEGISKSENPLTFNFESCENLLQTADSELTRLQDEQLRRKREKIDLEYQWMTTNNVYEKLRSRHKTVKKTVVITIQSPKSEKLTATLSYLINGATWYPAYDIRIQAETGAVTLSAFGIVRQSTGEDWTDIPITLSTAVPALSADLPKLKGIVLAEQFLAPPPFKINSKILSSQSDVKFQTAYTVSASLMPAAGQTQNTPPLKKEKSQYTVKYSEAGSLSRERNVQMEAVQSNIIDRQNTMTKNQIILGNGTQYDDCTILETEKSNLKIRTRDGKNLTLALDQITRMNSCTVQTSGLDISPERLTSPVTSAGGFDYRFPTARLENIPSDNQYRRILLKSSALKGEQYYAIVPAYSEHAYLMCRTVNTLNAPILPGPANLFYGSDYTADIDLPRIDENMPYDLPLGVDPRVKTERKTYKSSETIGMISKARQTSITTEITVNNNTPAPINIQLDDSIPVSVFEKVIIRNPTYTSPPAASGDSKENPEYLPPGIQRWRIKIPAHEKNKLNIQYIIEYPTDFVVTHGLDDSSVPSTGFGPTIDQAKNKKGDQ